MQIPEKLSHYRVLKKLGKGGMGEVYLAEDTTLERQVALKILPQELAADADRLRRFIQEAKAASILKHPNVASIYELGEADNVHFIVMEHVDGETVDDRLKRDGLGINEVVDIAIQAADALDDAHSRGIVHRDIKPSNLMITPRGQVKVLDFGLAKITAPSKKTVSDLKTLTGTEPGMILGTLQFMSPEQALGRKVDGRSDFFSLGVSLYQMVTGKLPFTGASPTQILARIINEAPEPIVRFNYNVPPELDHVIRKCLEKDPARRYQTARELLIDLQNLKRDMQSGSPITVAGGWRPAVSKKSNALKLFLVLIPLFAVISWLFLRNQNVSEKPTAQTGSTRKMVVVLPFENLGSSEDEYFADGMTEEITSRLATVNQLGVISRSSALQYKNGEKSIKQIGEELRVDYVIDGTVRWSHTGETSRVRVTPQLIRVSDDTQIWSQVYDHVMEDVFQVQTDIAKNVIAQLDVKLGQSERKAIAIAPTNNVEAYQVFLRGRENFDKPSYDQEHLNRTAELFELATRLDPNFSQAYAMFARVNVLLFHEGIDSSAERLQKAKTAIEKALSLDPDSPYVQVALGYYLYHGLSDYDGALKAFNSALKSAPNFAESFSAIAYVLRRQGKFQQSLEYLHRKLELDPKSSQINVDIAVILTRLHRYEEADRYFESSIILFPEQPYPYGLRALNMISWKGDLAASRAILEEMPKTEPLYFERFWMLQEMFERDFKSAVSQILDSPAAVFSEEGLYEPKALTLGYLYSYMNEAEKSKAYFQEAVSILEAKRKNDPDNEAVNSALGLAYAGLGNKEQAIAAGKRAVELNPVSKDSLMGPNAVRNLAQIYALLGQKEEALKQLDRLLSIPAWFSVHDLKLDPIWDPLREDSRYAELLLKYSK